MRLHAIAICLILASSAGAASLGELSWMTGHWRSSSGESVSEELWTTPAGGLMLGLHRDLRPGKQAFFEFLRIEERDGTIAFIAQPGGRTPTSFPLASLDGMKAVFENPEHDFPQRIIYRIDGDQLCARAEGTTNGKESGSEWCWTRVEE